MKIKLVGVDSVTTSFGVVNENEEIDLPDELAKNLLRQGGIWVAVQDVPVKSPQDKSLKPKDTK